MEATNIEQWNRADAFELADALWCLWNAPVPLPGAFLAVSLNPLDDTIYRCIQYRISGSNLVAAR